MARHDADDRAGDGRAIVVYRSTLDASAEEVFRWHERSEALAALMPSTRLMRIDRSPGGVRDAVVTISIGLGSWRVRWIARHYGFVDGRQFCDELISGPLRMWRHVHRFQPVSAARSVYEDRIEYSLYGGPSMTRMLSPLLRRLLGRLFSWRHAVVRRELLAAARPGRASGAANDPARAGASAPPSPP